MQPLRPRRVPPPDRFHDELAEANALTDPSARIARYGELIARHPVRADLLRFNLAVALDAAGRAQTAATEAQLLVRQSPLLWERLPPRLQLASFAELPAALRWQHRLRVDPAVFVGRTLGRHRLTRLTSAAPSLALFDVDGGAVPMTARLWRRETALERRATAGCAVRGYARVLELANDDGIVFELLERAAGRSVDEIYREARFGVVMALEIGRQVCRVLAALHGDGHAHGAVAAELVVCEESRLVPLVTLLAAPSSAAAPASASEDLRALGRLLELLLCGDVDPTGQTPLRARLPATLRDGAAVSEAIALAEQIVGRCRRDQASSAQQLAEQLARATSPATLSRQPTLVPLPKVAPAAPRPLPVPARIRPPAPRGPHGTFVLGDDPDRPRAAPTPPPRRFPLPVVVVIGLLLLAIAATAASLLRRVPEPPVPVPTPPPATSPQRAPLAPLPLGAARASSAATGCHGRCAAARAIDHDPATAWCFDSRRDPAPQLTLDWRGSATATVLDVATGYPKSEAAFDGNGRPTELRVSDAQGVVGTYPLSATWEMHDNRLRLERPAHPPLRIEITGLDPGRRAPDACLAEVAAWQGEITVDPAR